MHRAALLALLLATAGFVPGGEPALVTTGKPVRVQTATTDVTPVRAQAASQPSRRRAGRRCGIATPACRCA